MYVHVHTVMYILLCHYMEVCVFYLLLLCKSRFYLSALTSTGQWIIPALRQVLNLVKHMVKQATTRADKSKVLTDIHKSSEITKLLVYSLVQCHQTAVQRAQSLSVPLSPELLIDEKYTHQEVRNHQSVLWSKTVFKLSVL